MMKRVGTPETSECAESHTQSHPQAQVANCCWEHMSAHQALTARVCKAKPRANFTLFCSRTRVDPGSSSTERQNHEQDSCKAKVATAWTSKSQPRLMSEGSRKSRHSSAVRVSPAAVHPRSCHKLLPLPRLLHVEGGEASLHVRTLLCELIEEESWLIFEKQSSSKAMFSLSFSCATRMHSSKQFSRHRSHVQILSALCTTGVSVPRALPRSTRSGNAGSFSCHRCHLFQT